MAKTVTIKGATAGTTYDRARTLCYIKRNWDSSWIWVPYLEPLYAEDAVAPAMSRASFAYRYGDIKREDSTAFGTYDPLHLIGCYVKIVVLHDGGGHTFWVGYIPEEQFALHGGSVAAGDQKISAYGLEFLLDRDTIRGGRIEQNEGTADSPNMVEFDVGITPTFNRTDSGDLRLIGNRSLNRNTDGVYVFCTDRNLRFWSRKTALEYLLQYHGPAATTFRLAGQISLLDDGDEWYSAGKEVFEVEGLTLRQALDRLIPYRRGVGWKIRTSGSGVVSIHVFSVLSQPVSVADRIIPANSEAASLYLRDILDVEESTISINETTHYDKIIVRGAPIKTCLTASFYAGTLEEGWLEDMNGNAEENYMKAASLAEGYDELNPHDQFLLNEEERKQEKYGNVFTVFRIPSSFNWLVGDPETQSRTLSAAPLCDKDGRVDENAITAQPGVWNFNKPLLPFIPLVDAFDYSEDQGYLPFVSPDPDTGRPYGWAFRKPLVLANLIGLPDFADDLHYHCLNHPNDDVPVDREISVLPAGMGLRVKMDPPYLLAWNKANDPDWATCRLPVLAYNRLLATIFAETSWPLSVEVDIHDSENQKTLVINVPDAELWYVAPFTIVGVKYVPYTIPIEQRTTGQVFGGYRPVYYNASSRIVRDDSERLRRVASLARAWYGRPRAKISVTLKRITACVPAGALIRNFKTPSHSAGVNSPVTNVAWDFRTGTTTIQTDYSELDPTSIVF